MAKRTCSIPDCGRPHYARDLCTMHYQRWRLHGHPLGGRPTFTGDPARFIERAIRSTTDGCIDWPYSRDSEGYGSFWVERHREPAHRYVLTATNGPSDLLALHSCDNPPCINPAHLRWGTPVDNGDDMKSRGRAGNGFGVVLTARQEQDIRDRYAAGGVSQRVLAIEYGISRGRMMKLIRRTVV